ncbi:hypothetical protein Pcinc_014400 [Petrolisthes cinctipes]|uniref:Uncharacterized protein n=1 Tax=Petrolisthes cinctipes TaxID=88211 RepID=A0AAE1KRU0_PETCI|nr:hypothetical protein Pcinc_014400 [Petrolisthes cinctipes]
MTSPRKSIQQQDIINFVHLVVFPVIGYITGIKNLCCVDKKGVLSWPNPTTEKVFFPQEQSTQPHNYQLVISPSIGNDGMFEEIKLERNSSLQHNQRITTSS